MIVETFVTGPLEENCYLVRSSQGEEAALIDPGDDGEELLAELTARGVRLTRILLTHAHFDHVGAVALLQQASGAQVLLHEGEKSILAGLPLQSALFGLSAPEPFQVSTWLKGGEKIAIGSLELQVLATPGHSAGGISFYGHGHLFPGDVLFRSSIGRSDLPGGDGALLLHSIRTRLFSLPDETIVHPGHGEETTIGYEKRYNPFLG
ncbi:MAG: putative metallo-hydrolase [bacterium ADurb.Bin431]|nr:MAG: putative metallo-hydrolase [bacterium ADurb.Bin431]HOC25126.1 MBL fold metallo-hydrolase [bacterium]HOH06661.1 MBL fold metallo-hydrolase [bacterium]